MRHNRTINHLGRKSGHRKSMLANMACSLILHKRIETTVAKAKALRVYVEPLITKSKDDSTHSRRTVFAYLKQKEAVTELFRNVAPKIADRPGGYTRIIKTGFRQGDAADMAFIELVDFNEAALGTHRAGRLQRGSSRNIQGSREEDLYPPQPQESRSQGRGRSRSRGTQGRGSRSRGGSQSRVITAVLAVESRSALPRAGFFRICLLSLHFYVILQN